MSSAPHPGMARLARPAALAIEPYVWEIANHEVAARYQLPVGDVVRFDTNTSPLPPPSVPSVLRRIEAEPWVNEYFDGSYAALAAALADYTGFTPAHFVIGAGADEILDVLAKTFLDPGDPVVIPSPTYSLYRIAAHSMGASIRTIRARADLAFDLAAIADAGHDAKAIFLCNPNNPTGLAVPVEQIEALVQAVRGLVIVDEAYAEFSGRSAIELTRRYPRLIVVRTLSKAFALAGARVGYCVCDPETAGLANRMRPPNSISYPGAMLAEAALRDLPAMRASVHALLEQRRILSEALSAMGRQVVPSAANFVLARWPSAEAAARAHEHCLSRGLVLRAYAGNPVLSAYLRVTARNAHQTSQVIEALKTVPL